MLGDAEDDDFILNDPAEKFIIQPRKPVNAEPQFKRPLKRQRKSLPVAPSDDSTILIQDTPQQSVTKRLVQHDDPIVDSSPLIVSRRTTPKKPALHHDVVVISSSPEPQLPAQDSVVEVIHVPTSTPQLKREKKHDGVFNPGDSLFSSDDEEMSPLKGFVALNELGNASGYMKQFQAGDVDESRPEPAQAAKKQSYRGAHGKRWTGRRRGGRQKK